MLNIPSHTGCHNCGECCGIIPASKQEADLIQGYLAKHPEIRQIAGSGEINCPFRCEKTKKCLIYPVRPILCKMMGVCAGMSCKHGNSKEIDMQKFAAFLPQKDFAVLNGIDWTKEATK